MPPSPFATASQLKESSLIYQQSWWRMQQRLLAWDENKNKKKSEQSIMLPAFNTQWMPFHQHHSSSSKGSSKGSTTTTTMPMASVNLPVFFCCSDYSFFHHHQKHTGCYHHHNFGLENSNKNHYHATGYGPQKAPCYPYHSQNTKKQLQKEEVGVATIITQSTKRGRPLLPIQIIFTITKKKKQARKKRQIIITRHPMSLLTR